MTSTLCNTKIHRNKNRQIFVHTKFAMFVIDVRQDAISIATVARLKNKSQLALKDRNFFFLLYFVLLINIYNFLTML